MIKKILFLIIAFISIIPFTNVYAGTTEDNWIEVEVTEAIPWAGCSTTKNENWKYTCTVQKGFWTVISMLWNIIEYLTFIAWLWSILYLIINWIIYSMSWLIGSKDEAKKRITDNLLWIILLLLSWPILFIVAPWIYQNI